MALVKKIKLFWIVALAVFLVIPFVSAELKLGEGCIAGSYYEPCAGGCTWSCSGTDIVKTCTQAHGWCFNEDNSCYACDFRSVNPHTCSRIECSRMNGWEYGTSRCNEAGNVEQVFATYSCNTNTKTCTASRELRPKEVSNNECCPIRGNEEIGTFTFTKIDNPGRNPYHLFEIPDSRIPIVDAGNLKVIIEAGFTLEAGDQAHGLMVDAVKADGTLIQTLYDSYRTITGEVTTPYLVIPTGTRKIRVVEECGEYTCAEATASVKISCDCTQFYWVFDNDGDGEYSYKVTNPSCNLDLNTFCAPFSAYPECRDATKWKAVSEGHSNWESNSCRPGATYLTSSDCKEADNDARRNKNTIYCRDNDNDEYGTSCQTMLLTGGKPQYTLKEGNDCNDNNDLINPETIWIKNKDNDVRGYWGDVTVTCNPGSGWEIIETMPPETLYDCNDDVATITNPETCNCKEADKGKTITKADGTVYFCYDPNTDTRTKYTGTATFEIVKRYTGAKWTEATSRADYKGNFVTCPKTTCPLKIGNEPSCVQAGTYWPDNAINADKAGQGDRYCYLDENGEAYWGTRSSKISNFLVSVGEKTGKDFVVYCDDFTNIANTFFVSNPLASTGIPNVRNYLAILLGGSPDTTVGNGCVLIVNDGYTAKIEAGEDVEADDQKIIIGLPLVNQKIKTSYFNIDFSNPTTNVNRPNWLEKKENGLYIYEPLNILFIIQAKPTTAHPNGKVDSFLYQTFDNARVPNSFTSNFFGFLRNPLSQFKDVLSEGYWENFDAVSIKSFDRSFIGKQDNFYFYSVLNNNDLLAKITNPEQNEEEKTKEFIYEVCKNGFNGNTFECTNVDTTNPFNEDNFPDSVGLKATLSSATKEETWQAFSRQLRLKGNDASGTSFYTQECYPNGAGDDCPPRTCHRVSNCNVMGMCVYTPSTCNNVAKDNCCPAGCTYENTDPAKKDLDCIPIPPVTRMVSRITSGSCDGADEITLFYMSNNKENAHISTTPYDIEPQTRVCLFAEKGLLEKQISTTSCSEGFYPVIRLAQESDSHAGSETTYSTVVCLKHQSDTISCQINSEKECAGYEQIISLTGTENAHAGIPSVYDYKLCCKVYSQN